MSIVRHKCPKRVAASNIIEIIAWRIDDIDRGL